MPIVNLTSLPTFQAINLRLDPGATGGPRHVPQCADIILYWGLETGIAGHCVLTGRYSGPFAGSVAQADSILTSLTTGAQWAALAGFLAPSTALAFVQIRDINPLDGSGQLIQSTGAPHLGTSASPALPNEVAACVTKRTARAGRQNRGRFFVPGFATNALGAGNVIAAAAVTALQNWASSNIGSAFAASGYTHVLAQLERQAYTSPITGTAFPARPAGSVDITSLVVRDNHWDSQRRRGLP